MGSGQSPSVFDSAASIALPNAPPSPDRPAQFENRDGFGYLHHVIGPQNVEELKVIHRQAGPTATFYITTIICLYLLGLAVILVHYMNNYYGAWNWTFADVWIEVKPMFTWCFRKKKQSQMGGQEGAREDKIEDASEVSSQTSSPTAHSGHKRNISRGPQEL